MRSLRVAFFFFFVFICIGGVEPLWASVAQVEVIHSQDKYPAGGLYPIAFKVRIKKQWYLHGPAKEPEAGLIPTTLEIQSAEGVSIQDIAFPPTSSKKFPYTDEPVEVYSGTIVVRASIRVESGVAPDMKSLKGILKYQPCSESLCLAPETVPFEIRVEIAPIGASVRPLNQELFASLDQEAPQAPGSLGTRFGGGMLLGLLGVFLGGLALNLTPCVYPLIPITVSYFGGRGAMALGVRIVHGAVYVAGLSITNSALGVAAALGGGMMGEALQSPIVLAGVAGILLAMGLSFFGLWEMRLPPRLVRVASKGFGGLCGTFFMGLTLGIVAAPCLGPFILGLLTFVGQKGDLFLGFIYFFVLSLGIGLPLALLGIFSGAIEKLPVSGDWMLWIRKCLGWVLIGMAIYMVMPLVPGHDTRAVLVAAAFFAAGIHLGWIDKASAPARRFLVVKKGLGVLLMGVGVFWALSGLKAPEEGITWIPYREGILQEAREKGLPVMLDFYADWCAPCREMEETTFRDEEVVQLASRLKAVRVDLTRKDPAHDKLIKRFRIRGVPTIVFLRPDGEEVRELRVESYATARTLKTRMLHLFRELDSS